MFKSYLSRAVSPGIGIHLPASIEEIRDAYAMLNGWIGRMRGCLERRLK